uniref:Uncharacterized protein n=1 Tax=Anguilla anguilla TaxID=7936 RepID=A0A0E9X221_ANGAN
MLLLARSTSFVIVLLLATSSELLCTNANALHVL